MQNVRVAVQVLTMLPQPLAKQVAWLGCCAIPENALWRRASAGAASPPTMSAAAAANEINLCVRCMIRDLSGEDVRDAGTRRPPRTSPPVSALHEQRDSVHPGRCRTSSRVTRRVRDP